MVCCAVLQSSLHCEINEQEMLLAPHTDIKQGGYIKVEAKDLVTLQDLGSSDTDIERQGCWKSTNADYAQHPNLPRPAIANRKAGKSANIMNEWNLPLKEKESR